jgi:hypothetical protein
MFRRALSSVVDIPKSHLNGCGSLALAAKQRTVQMAFGILGKAPPSRYALLAALMLVGGTFSGCQSQRQMVTAHEDQLAAAGFLVRPANTPEREAMLRRLPPLKFIERVRGDAVHYVYADPLVCNCLYVGSQQAYNQFKLHEQQQRLADEQLLTAQMYSDPAWSWGAWGPWGPDYGFSYRGGLGW